MASDKMPKALLEALDLIRSTKAPGLQSLDNLEARHVDRVRDLFQDPNIVAIGIAEKITEKKATHELGLCFYVEKKLSRARLNSHKLVPPVLSVADRRAVFTDVQEIGRVRPEINKRKTPLRSGFSIGNANETGTLGAIVKKGDGYFVLSNSHVLADSGRAKKGAPIYYPGEADTSGKLQQVGKLSAFAPFKPGDDFLNRVDAALAEIEADFVERADFAIRGTKKPLATIAPVRGMKIVSCGRTSGNTQGEVQDVHFSVVLKYPGIGTIGFIDQVKCTNYSKPGDSGSIIVDKKSGKIVGLHFAGSGNASIFNPIGEVIKALDFRFAAK